MKTVITILVVILLAGLGYYYFQMTGTDTQESTDDTSGQAISIEARYPGKFVYTTDTTQNAEPYRKHCSTTGGTFNACGTTCAPSADVCAQVCAYTCQFPAEND